MSRDVCDYDSMSSCDHECDPCGPSEEGDAVSDLIHAIERDGSEWYEKPGVDARIAELKAELKHLHSRWDWTEYWFDNLYPTDWQRCQARYDATKVRARPVAERETT